MSELDEGMGETARKRFVPRRRKAPLGRGDKLPAGEEGDNDGGDANERSLLVIQEDVHNPISEQSEKEPLRNRERKQTSAIPRDEYQSEQTGEKLPSSGDRMFRSDPLKELLARQRRLDRVSAAELPELHCVGQIRSCQGLVLEASEGACCRWRIDFDKAWQHLGGELAGQTHVSHCRHVASEELVLNHPIDLHFAETAMHVWGAPRIQVQGFRMDKYGRRVLAGYGFAHINLNPGFHLMDIPLWRPTGDAGQELEAYFLGKTPSLVSHEPIYGTAWKDRCRLVTSGAGRVTIELFIASRFTSKHGIDGLS